MGRRLLLAPLLALCLALSLPVTGWAMGLSARTAQVIVVCKAHGAEAVALDWQGQPVELLPHCPDCTMAAGPVPERAVADDPVSAVGSVLRASPVIDQPTSGFADRSLWPRAPPV